MKFYLCIDDTDNLDSIGTGTIAEQIQQKLIAAGYGPCSLITRHQLFIHQDIPYTSHNSSMCFHGEAPEDALTDIITFASHHLDTVAAAGSDRGIDPCVRRDPDDRRLGPDRRPAQECFWRDARYSGGGRGHAGLDGGNALPEQCRHGTDRSAHRGNAGQAVGV